MPQKSPWSANDYDAARLALGRHKRVTDALPEISRALGRNVAERSLAAAFTLIGERPGQHIGSRSPFLPSPLPVSGLSARASSFDPPKPEPSLGTDPVSKRYEPRIHGGAAAKAPTHTPDAKLTKILIIPDMHHPYADELVWKTILAAVREMRPDIVVIIGDFCDFYSVSFHAKDPARGSKLRAELDYCNDALNELSALGVERVIYVEGNHENRLARWVAERAPELFRMLTVQELLGIEKRGWEWVPYKSWITIGKMSYTHDVERCGINAGRQSLIDFGGNLTFGHSHRGSTTYVGTLEDGQHVCLNVGHGSDYTKVDYRNQARAKRDWQHGFGWQVQTSDGATWCQFVPILSGRCVVDGKLITGRGP